MRWRILNSGEGDELLLVSEPKIRSTRVIRKPERYNQTSGQSDLQYCHNIVKQMKEEGRFLEYDESETTIVANIMTKMRK